MENLNGLGCSVGLHPGAQPEDLPGGPVLQVPPGQQDHQCQGGRHALTQGKS